jgi:hypothetical protein
METLIDLIADVVAARERVIAAVADITEDAATWSFAPTE